MLGLNLDTIVMGPPMFKWTSTGRVVIRAISGVICGITGTAGLPMLFWYVRRALLDDSK